MKQRRSILWGISLAVLSLSLVACGNDKEGTKGNETKGEATSTTGEKSSTSEASSDGPVSSMRAMLEASKAKDLEGAKKYLSKGTLELMENMAKQQGKTLDASLREDMEKPDANNEMPETRNEEINGDVATVEMKDKDDAQWTKMHFVKEEGIWKIAMDKMLQEAMQNAGSGMDTTKK